MPAGNATVWRYTDLGKYLDLITRRELWFTRVSTLRAMDPYEGALTSYDVKKTTDILAVSSPEELKAALIRHNETGIASMMDGVYGKSQYLFQLVYLSKLPLVDLNLYTHSVSCWHSNATDSDGMWELYAKRAAGVAIGSTVPRLLKAFESSKRNLFVAKVNYDSDNRLSAMSPGIFDSFLGCGIFTLRTTGMESSNGFLTGPALCPDPARRRLSSRSFSSSWIATQVGNDAIKIVMKNKAADQ